MTDAEWAEKEKVEREAFERFHGMRKYNSSRRARQEAWAETERILEERRRRSRRTHPIAPKDRYWDFMDEAPPGWTYPAWRTLEDDEVDAMFPGARAAFENQNIGPSRFVYESYDNKLRVSVPNIGTGYRAVNMTWLPDMRIWRRYQRAVKVKPYRQPDTDTSVATLVFDGVQAWAVTP